jgi:hypothetical protein
MLHCLGAMRLVGTAPRCLQHLGGCRVRVGQPALLLRHAYHPLPLAALGRDTIEKEASSIAAREEAPVPPDEEYGVVGGPLPCTTVAQ